MRNPRAAPSGNGSVAGAPVVDRAAADAELAGDSAVRDGRHGVSEACTPVKRTPRAASESMTGLVGRP